MVVALHGYVPAAYAGLALAFSSQLSGMLQYTVRLATDTETRFISVQRMHTSLQVFQTFIIIIILLSNTNSIFDSTSDA